jgi:HAE1 family hydrophobic/amphiphilic exporter-1
MSLVVLGIFSFRGLGIDLFPKADPAQVNVLLQLPGASPSEMATNVVVPMEEALSSISGIDEISSVNISEGRAVIDVKFVLERDINDAANDVREKVAVGMKNVPPQVLPPVITKTDPDSDPVMSLVLSSDTMSLRTLTEVANKQVQRSIETVNGVGQVDLFGGRAREIHVVVDLEKLNSYGLSMSQVRDAVINENVEIPGGSVQQGKSELLLRTMGRIDASSDFNNIVVATKNATPIRVSDIGYAEDSFERPTSGVWLGEAPAVQLDIRRAIGENTVSVIEGVRTRLQRVRQTLPAGVNLVVTRDDSEFIYSSVAALEEHLIWGSFLAAVVVMFFIRNIRAVLISALAIPASIIATFTLMRAMDFTLNNMTLLGITLAVGIVIDDAIVVLENIFRHIEEKGSSPFEAAIEGTREVALAVMATTLSLVVIFLPVAFMTGYARRYINPFAWTMAFSIMVSMLVSFTLTPMLSSRFLTVSDAAADHKTKERGFFHWLDTAYTGWVAWSLDRAWVVIGVSVVAFLLTFPLNRMVGRTFVPNEDMGQFTIHLDAPEGTTLEGTEQIAKSLVRELSGIEGIATLQPTTNTRMTHIHLLGFLTPFEERKATMNQVVAELRRRLAAHPSYKPSVSPRSPLGGGEGLGNNPLVVNIEAADMDRLVEYSLQAYAAARKVPGLADLRLGLNLSNPEVHVEVDRKRAADLGVRMATVGNTLRLAVAGDDEISSYREGQEQYPVKIRVLENQRNDIDAIGKLTVPSATGAPVRVDSIAQLTRGLGPATVSRTDRQYFTSLQADIAPGYALDQLSNNLRRMMTDLRLPPDVTFRMSGQTKILDDTTQNLLMAIGLAMIFVYMVLAAQFESFVQPIVIMVTLPLSIPFALFTLWATGRTLNLWSALGVLLLLGIVKKNAILQVDYANVLRAGGMPMRQAVIEACRTRLRPILMTTAAIIAGLIPTSLGLGIGGQGRAAIAITVIGGQSLCLFLTLLLVPVLYIKLDGLEQSMAHMQVKGLLGRVRAATVGRLRTAT